MDCTSGDASEKTSLKWRKKTTTKDYVTFSGQITKSCFKTTVFVLMCDYRGSSDMVMSSREHSQLKLIYTLISTKSNQPPTPSSYSFIQTPSTARYSSAAFASRVGGQPTRSSLIQFRNVNESCLAMNKLPSNLSKSFICAPLIRIIWDQRRLNSQEAPSAKSWLEERN